MAGHETLPVAGDFSAQESYTCAMSAKADNIDWDGLVGLFRPGSGAMPPKLAGRDAILDELSILLNDISKFNRAPAGDAVLYGPRGNGKTVLLSAFENQCESKGADVIARTPDAIRTEADLAAHLLYDDSLFSQFLEAIRSRAGADLGLGFARVTWDNLNQAERDNYKRRHLVDLLAARCRSAPLVVTLDEAHTLDPEVGRRLLNASQLAQRKGARFLLVLAGTPNLRSRLDSMSATFWDRAEVFGIGRLDAGATSEALVAPLQNYGIDLDEDALEAVITESQWYPYFIQLWGGALCEALAARKSTHIDMAIVEAARPAFTSKKVFYYEKRYEEVRNRDLLDSAKAVADMFRNERCIDDDILQKQLASGLSTGSQGVLDVIRDLSHLGFIWKPPASASVEPGIPSLMDYVLTERQELTGTLRVE
ncbi:MAG: ATP-binding protein [Gammaproteobacteria bacterium]|nr:ATP-binding protein [Gammaproteobacteria bacterium]